MKMAKASMADLEMAMELANAMENLNSRWGAMMPEKIAKRGADEDEGEGFTLDDDDCCRRVCEYLIRLTSGASLFRVAMGMAVLLDPRNKVVDPIADTLEHHPDRKALDAVIEAVRAYHSALDQRAHGGVAQGAAISKIEEALGMPWVQGASLKAAAPDAGELVSG